MKKQLFPKMLPIAMVGIILFVALATGCEQKTPEHPKPSVTVGTWIQSEKVAEKDNQAHPMKYRIDAIIRDQKIVMDAIDEYNLSGTGNIIGKLESKELEFCMAKYSAVYPKDFPHSVFGITDVTIPFEIVSLTGGVIQVEKTVYKNLTSTWEIGNTPQGYDFHAGDTYHGQVIFIMVKGYGDYLIHEMKENQEDESQTYIKGE